MSLVLQGIQCGADLFVPITTGVFDLLSHLVVSHVHIRVVTWPLNVWNVQADLTLDVLHRPLDACRELLRTGYAQHITRTVLLLEYVTHWQSQQIKTNRQLVVLLTVI